MSWGQEKMADFTKCGEFVNSVRNCLAFQEGLSRMQIAVSHLTDTSAAFLVNGTLTATVTPQLFAGFLNPSTEVSPTSLRGGSLHIQRFRPALQSIQLPIKCEPGVIMPGVKRPRREANKLMSRLKGSAAIPLLWCAHTQLYFGRNRTT